MSREQLICQNHLNNHLPIAWLKDHGYGREEDHVFVPDRPFSLCVVGFGPLSREFLLTTYENTAFETSVSRTGRSGRPDCVQRTWPTVGGLLSRLFPEVAQNPGLTWLERGAEEDAFFEALNSGWTG